LSEPSLERASLLSVKVAQICKGWLSPKPSSNGEGGAAETYLDSEASAGESPEWGVAGESAEWEAPERRERCRKRESMNEGEGHKRTHNEGEHKRTKEKGEHEQTKEKCSGFVLFIFFLFRPSRSVSGFQK